MEIQNEIDKLNTLKESFSKIANSYSSLVPKEFVTIQLHAENTDLSAYKIKVVNTTSGNEEFYDISASGYTEFEVKYDSVYEIVFPIIGAYITPATRTFTAQKPIRKIEASYVMAGVFGLDEQGNRYSIEQIAALEDKSIIKYGGFTNYDLENTQREDGSYGCGFMWDLQQENTTAKWASSEVEFSQELLPFLTSEATALTFCDGELYTKYMVIESTRLGVEIPAASICQSRTLSINGETYKGFQPAFGQIRRLSLNASGFESLYTTLGLTAPNIRSGSWLTSCQYSKGDAVYINSAGLRNVSKTYAGCLILTIYNLPK